MEGFLGSLDDDERQALYDAGATRRYRQGTFLFTEGEASEHVAVLLDGRAKVSSFTEDGRELLLAVRGPGDLLGELSALDGEPRSASVSAIEALSACVVPSTRFEQFLTEYPRVAVLLLQMLTARLRDADRKRIEFGAHDTTGRVALRLVELAERFGSPEGGGLRIDIKLSQEELAGWTGSSREAVAKALRTLREREWIETHRRSIVVLDLDALRGLI